MLLLLQSYLINFIHLIVNYVWINTKKLLNWLKNNQYLIKNLCKTFKISKFVFVFYANFYLSINWINTTKPAKVKNKQQHTHKAILTILYLINNYKLFVRFALHNNLTHRKYCILFNTNIYSFICEIIVIFNNEPTKNTFK